MGWLSDFLSRVVAALIAAWFGERARQQSAEAHGQAGASDAANETKDVILETADARASLPPSPVDVDDLARELRAERRDAAKGGPSAARRRRPF